MATAEQYAQWLIDNQGKQGTTEFATVTEAYKAARQPSAQPSNVVKTLSSGDQVIRLPTGDMQYIDQKAGIATKTPAVI